MWIRTNSLFLAALSISLLASTLLAMGDPTIVRGPYLQLVTPTSTIVRWQTDTPTDSRVEFGTSVGNLSMAVDDPTITTEHIINLTGLAANTHYFYSVGTSTLTLAGDDADHTLKTSPLAGTAEPVRIWVIGDSGIAGDDQRAVRDAYLNHAANNPADVWIMLGDNAYGVGSQGDYQRAVFDAYPSILRTTSMSPTMGNHDGIFADSETESGPYYDIYSLPREAQAGGVASGTQAYYSFDYANVHFVSLNSHDVLRGTNDPMLTWLANDLAATTQTWVIAFWHNAPYSDGHNSDDFLHEPAMVEMRQNANPILEAAGVDLVLSGHSHSYERSLLLDGHYGLSNTFNPSMNIDSGNGQENGDGVYAKPTAGLAPHEGTVYVVAGNASLITGDLPNHPAMPITNLELGSMIIDVNGTRLDASFLNDQGIISDHFTITKGPQPCRADLDADGTLNFFDISEFLKTFAANEPIADFTNDGLFNFFDIAAFLQAFANGCP